MTSDLLNTLNVRIVGQGDRYLILAHGFGADQSAWQRMLPFFVPHYRIVLYDLVCAGTVNPSHFDFGRYSTLDGYVEDLMYIIDALRINRCFYVGHSISAMIGTLAAIRRPHLFTKLILVNASPRFLNDEDYNCGFDQEEIEQVFKAMESNYAAWANGYAPLAVGSDVPAVIREFSRTLFNMRPDISLHVLRTVFSSDLRGILGMVRVPCCIVQTVHDVSLPSSAATYLRNHLGGHCTVELLNTEGHLPHLTAPGQLARVLRRVQIRHE